MKVFIVTTGEYSDYSFHSVWSTQEKAEEMVKILNCDSYSYATFDEFEVDKPCEEKAGFEVVISLNTGELIKKDWGKNPDTCVLETPRVFYNSEKMAVYSQHFSLEQALKSARDFRMAELAKLNNI